MKHNEGKTKQNKIKQNMIIWIDTEKEYHRGGAWMAQLVEHPAPDFSSGHDIMVPEFESHIRLCADNAEPA